MLALALVSGCAAPGAQTLRVRVLNTEAPSPPLAEPAPRNDTPEAQPERVAPPRLGAPGGSGAGSRRVTPAAATSVGQSGNETVGGLPAGIGGVIGPLG
jgi:hypothetical protein